MAKKNLIEVEVEIDPKSAKKLQKKSIREIERATVGTVNRLTARAEDATQITQYTQTARPNKPTGSDYMRTFQLQRSSERRIIRDTLPVEGIWEAKTQYASMVIGLAAQQAPIHAGRWPALELAINQVNANAQKDFDKEVERLTK
jgi:hypothetical protein